MRRLAERKTLGMVAIALAAVRTQGALLSGTLAPAIQWYPLPEGLCPQGMCDPGTNARTYMPLMQASHGQTVFAVAAYSSGCTVSGCLEGTPEGRVWTSQNAGTTWQYKGMWSALAREGGAIVVHEVPRTGRIIVCVIGGNLAAVFPLPINVTDTVICATDAADDWWQSPVRLPVAVQLAAAVSFRGQIFVAGGTPDAAPFNVVDAPRLLEAIPDPRFEAGGMPALNAAGLAGAAISSWKRIDAAAPWRQTLMSPVLSKSRFVARKVYNNSAQTEALVLMGGFWIVQSGVKQTDIDRMYVTASHPSNPAGWSTRLLGLPQLIETITPRWSGVQIVGDLHGNMTRGSIGQPGTLMTGDDPNDIYSGLLIMVHTEAFLVYDMPLSGRLFSVVPGFNSLVKGTIPFSQLLHPRAPILIHDADNYPIILAGQATVMRGYFRYCEPCPDKTVLTRSCPMSPLASDCRPCTQCPPNSRAVQRCSPRVQNQDNICGLCNTCPGPLLKIGGCDGFNDTVCGFPRAPSIQVSPGASLIALRACGATVLASIAVAFLGVATSVLHNDPVLSKRWAAAKSRLRCGRRRQPKPSKRHLGEVVGDASSMKWAPREVLNPAARRRDGLEIPHVAGSTKSDSDLSGYLPLPPARTALPLTVGPIYAEFVHGKPSQPATQSTPSPTLSRDVWVTVSSLAALGATAAATAIAGLVWIEVPPANTSFASTRLFILGGISIHAGIHMAAVFAPIVLTLLSVSERAAMWRYLGRYARSALCILLLSVTHSRHLLLTSKGGFAGQLRLRVPWTPAAEMLLDSSVWMLSLVSDSYFALYGFVLLSHPDINSSFYILAWLQGGFGACGLALTVAAWLIPAPIQKWFRKLMKC